MANSSVDPVNLRGILAGLTSGSGRSQSVGNPPELNAPQSDTNRLPYSLNLYTPNSSSRIVGSEAMSPKNPSSKSGTPVPNTDQSNTDRTASLLNLLKFNQPSIASHNSTPQTPMPSFNSRSNFGAPQPMHSPSTQNVHGRGISASDLLASLSPKPTSSIPRESTTIPPGAARAVEASGTAPNANPQDYLLQLLNRPKPSQGVSPQTFIKSFTPQSAEQPPRKVSQDYFLENRPSLSMQQVPPGRTRSFERKLPSRNDSPIRIFGSSDDKETTPFEPKDMPTHQPTKDSIFTYVNPFEQLAASSPRNMKPKSGSSTPLRESRTSSKLNSQAMNGTSRKQGSKEASPRPSRMNSSKILTLNGSEVLQSIESPAPAPLEDGRTQLEALMGIGAPSNDTEIVAEALNEIGSQVIKQVENNLAEAESPHSNVIIKEEDVEEEMEAILETVEGQLQDAVDEVKEELDKEENNSLLENVMSAEAADAVREIINGAANKDNGSLERGDSNKENPTKNQKDLVIVYNFPLRPFVSISLKQGKLPSLTFREEVVMDIARLKKEFDQIDRTLATASDDFIVYATSKPGLRVIRQEDGLDRTIFRETHDRIFSTTISTAATTSSLQGTQTLIATGVSGTVYWATICQANGDSLKDENLEKHGLSFPPMPAVDENTSGGQLKTRAKRSNRHPEFFAIGRGKSIQIVFPFHAKSFNLVNSTYVVDTETYFKERSLKINMGKAGKDFIFSEDDTAIATLDKSSRLRFWDIRDLTNEMNGTASKLASVEISSPILTFNTNVANEKSWPTSVLFVDKLRPYTKGIALRYVVVGMKQNHTLQLWDLSLGKAVQELSFPHEKESNAICSVSYHPASGIIVVGHPTRNSIYFIHLSAPKYNLPAMPQANYLQRLANKDMNLPKPESTAIMSGMREYSFSTKGHLRSIDLLPISNDSIKGSDNVDDPTLFELYVMHSKGVTCLSIKKEDLGWSLESKMIHPVDGEAVGCISVQDLREPQSIGFSEPSSINGDSMQPNSGLSHPATKPKESMKSATIPANIHNDTKPANLGPVTDVSRAVGTIPTNLMLNGGAAEKPEKKKKKRTATGQRELASSVPSLSSTVPDSYVSTVQRSRSPTKEQLASIGLGATISKPEKSGSMDISELSLSPKDTKVNHISVDTRAGSVSIPGDYLDKELKRVEKTVSAAFSKVLGHELDSLYRRMDNDKRAADAAEAGKQVAVLRLVSDCMTENVDKALARHIHHAIKQDVLPAISEITTSTLNTSISEIVTQQLHHEMPHQLKRVLPDVVNKSLQKPDILQNVSEQITSKIVGCVQDEFFTTLHSTVTPKFQNLAINTAHSISADTERRVREQLQTAELQHRKDNAKIEELTVLVHGLSEMVHTMAAAQSEFQSEILKLQQQSLQERQSSSGQLRRTSAVSSSQGLSPEQQELNMITGLMSEGLFEEGTIKVIIMLINSYSMANES